MNITRQRSGDTLLIAIDGRLDTLNSPQLEAELESGFDGVNHLVLDFKKVQYISSAGVRAILIAQQIMEDRGGRMTLRSIAPAVAKVLEFIGLMEYIEIE